MPSDVCDPREVTALVLAAGEGRRMGGKPKAFIEFQKRTLMARTLARVGPWAGRLVVGVREEDREQALKVIQSLPDAEKVHCVSGGATRQETLKRLLEHAATRFVLVHEVARAWTAPADFRNILAALRTHPAAVLYSHLPVRDSVGLLKGDTIGEILPRASLVALQTPHAYERNLLVNAYQLAGRENLREDSTAALVQLTGVPIHLVESVGGNFKLTYLEDLQQMAELCKFDELSRSAAMEKE